MRDARGRAAKPAVLPRKRDVLVCQMRNRRVFGPAQPGERRQAQRIAPLAQRQRRRQLRPPADRARLRELRRRQCIPLDFSVRRVDDARDAQQRRGHRADLAGLAVGRAPPEEQQIKRPQRLGCGAQRAGGRQRVGAGAGRVAQQRRMIDAARNQLAQRALGARRSHAQRGHLAAVRVAQAQRQLDGGFVRGVEHLRHELALERQVAAHTHLEGVGHLLDQTQYPHS